MARKGGLQTLGAIKLTMTMFTVQFEKELIKKALLILNNWNEKNTLHFLRVGFNDEFLIEFFFSLFFCLMELIVLL